MANATGNINGVTIAGTQAPIRFTDNGDGTFSVNIGAELTLSPTNLSLEATQQDVLDALLAGIVVTPKGAANLASSQATSTGTAATLVAARATRRSVLIRNTDSANSVWVGPATVTTSNGFLIKAGESVPFTWVGLLQIIDDASNHAVVCVADEYD